MKISKVTSKQNHPQKVYLMRTSFWIGHWDCEAHPCGYDGWKASRMLANDKSSNGLQRGIQQWKCKAQTPWTATSSEDEKNKPPPMPSSGSALHLRFEFLLSLLYTTYSVQPIPFLLLYTQPTRSLNVRYAPHVASPKALCRVQAH